MRIFLDDERYPADSLLYDIEGNYDIHIVRTFEDFVFLVTKNGLPSYISFDHDLGMYRTGYDCAMFLVDYCLDNQLKPDFNFDIHSQNPIGKARIENLLNKFKETH